MGGKTGRREDGGREDGKTAFPSSRPTVHRPPVLPSSRLFLVTGASGFIGSHLVDRLLERGDRVIGLDIRDGVPNLAGAASHPRFTLVRADITDRDAVRLALGSHEFDVVAHLAARVGVRPSVQDPAGYAHTNVTGTQVVLDLARERGARGFVFASSSSVYGNDAALPFQETEPSLHPVSPYGATKRSGELLCEAHQRLHGGGVLCLRFFTAYGPRQRADLAIPTFMEAIRAGKPVTLYGDGSAERDFTWVGDLVSGIVAAVDRAAGGPAAFEVVNLGSGRAVTLSRLVELLGGALGRKPAVQYAPPQPGDVNRTWADVSKAERLLGYVPAVTIERGVEMVAQRA